MCQSEIQMKKTASKMNFFGVYFLFSKKNIENFCFETKKY